MKAQVTVYSWDWKEQPSIRFILDKVLELERSQNMKYTAHEVETRSDEYAVLIGPASISDTQAKLAYHAWQERQDDGEDNLTVEFP